jgi:hypothetical protein
VPEVWDMIGTRFVLGLMLRFAPKSGLGCLRFELGFGLGCPRFGLDWWWVSN